ncbi:PQQ-dependent sugar dehydrogenase [Labrys neptuniae]|uniref:PQQ-dependent sugar dehydrogenase n=1 Tax=Labrys neptuniae TaxID=376174 RepID=UPI002891C635|nr:PQQ-dependent sugar dehydrogenase [Labrys neptuniae]MDT3375774.1 PQQ-dependent sugar dehydrogenase [Labrys neptuniae]
MRNAVRIALTAAIIGGIAALPGLALAEVNAANSPASTSRPFKTTTVARFDTPWAIAFLPDGRMLVTEKGGQLFLVTPAGAKSEVSGVPRVQAGGQNGLLDVAASPGFARDGLIYFSYVEPSVGGGTLALARAGLKEAGGKAGLDDLAVIWRASPKGGGGQPGGIIAFAPDGRHLFLSSGDRMEPETAQNTDTNRGKILRLNLDGTAPADNPMAAQGGVQAEIWSLGHRNPYGLAFAPDGSLWENEMGPRGGDELNLIRRGANYGWPLVSNGDNYSGVPIPRHRTRPEFEAPVIYWTPIIAPAGLAFYSGKLFPQWRGSAFIGALRGEALVRIAFDSKDGARQADRWEMGARIRDVAVDRDGAIWLIEDASDGRLLRLTPAK